MNYRMEYEREPSNLEASNVSNKNSLIDSLSSH